MKADLGTIAERLKRAKKALVVGHVRPDGDAIGSAAGLALILRELGVEAEACIPDRIPRHYRAIPGTSFVKRVEELREREFDTVVVIDSSDISRVGKAVSLFPKPRPDVVIDHHITNSGFGELNFCDPSAAATCLIIHELGKHLLPKGYTREIAELLLLGIATDTGFFRYADVDERVFAAAAELSRYGARIRPIAEALLENRTLNTVRLLSEMFRTLVLEEEGEIAYAYLSEGAFRRCGCEEDEAEGFISEIMSLRSVEVGALLIEWPKGEIHVSLRSKGRVNVSEIALAFGGGGHPRAAGCTLKGIPVEEALELVAARLREGLKRSVGT